MQSVRVTAEAGLRGVYAVRVSIVGGKSVVEGPVGCVVYRRVGEQGWVWAGSGGLERSDVRHGLVWQSAYWLGAECRQSVGRCVVLRAISWVWQLFSQLLLQKFLLI